MFNRELAEFEAAHGSLTAQLCEITSSDIASLRGGGNLITHILDSLPSERENVLPRWRKAYLGDADFAFGLLEGLADSQYLDPALRMRIALDLMPRALASGNPSTEPGQLQTHPQPTPRQASARRGTRLPEHLTNLCRQGASRG